MLPAQVIYLHGFASSPGSAKAQVLVPRLEQLGAEVVVPDLNEGGFERITLSRQIRQVEALLGGPGLQGCQVTIVGSSFGGLTAAWVAARNADQVERIAVMAPAFGFPRGMLDLLTEDQRQEWKSRGRIDVLHHAHDRELPLSYAIIEDAVSWPIDRLELRCPALILHGERDEVVPVERSVEFAARRSNVTLKLLDADHGMVELADRIWRELEAFLRLPSAIGSP